MAGTAGCVSRSMLTFSVVQKATPPRQFVLCHQEQEEHHCPISTSTTNIASSCACSGDQSRFGNWYMASVNQSSSRQPPRANHTTVSRCRYSDGGVVIDSTNGHLVLNYSLGFNEWNWGISQSISHSALYRRSYAVVIRLRSTPLPYHIRKVMPQKRV